MHRDKKLGLALGILLVGIVSAFFFRNEEELSSSAPQLNDPDWVDEAIAESTGPKPYPQSPETVRLADGGRAILTNEPVKGELARVEPAEPYSMFDLDTELPVETGTPAPITLNRVEPVDDRTNDAPIPWQDPNSGWQTRPASSRNGGSSGPSATAGTQDLFYVVKPGDTLSGLATQFLGSSQRYHEIYELNRNQMRSANDLRAGMKIRIPARQGTRQSSTVEHRAAARPVSTGTLEDLGTHPDEPTIRRTVQPNSPAETQEIRDREPEGHFRPYRRSPLAPRGASRDETRDQSNSMPTPSNPEARGDMLSLSGSPESGSARTTLSIVAAADNPTNSTARSQPATGATRYLVRPGESLDQIATRLYGSAAAADRIRAANSGRIPGDGRLAAGTAIVLP